MRTSTPRRTTASTSLLLLGIGLLPACTNSEDLLDEPPTPPGSQTNNVLDRSGSLGLSTFTELGSLSSFAVDLQDSSPITVFAPDDAAFAALGDARLDELRDPANLAQLDALIGRLLLAGDYDTALLSNFSTLVSATGDALQVARFVDFITIDEGRIIDEDAAADNGRLYVLDGVPDIPLPPIESLQRSGLTTLVQLIDVAGLSADVESGDFTILAPTEAAFAALAPGELDDLQLPRNRPELLARLRLHLVPGTRPFGRLEVDTGAQTVEGAQVFAYVDRAGFAFLNGASVERANRPTSAGGLVHELGTFLEVPPSLTEALTDPDLDTLEQLLATAALVPTLEGVEALTLFAPDESAFAALPPGTVDDLQLPQNAAALDTLLRSHALDASYPSSTIEDGDLLVTLAGTG
ncbi:MAG: fasciclin domain-containing protein, partial [Planctomycetota bacterium]|nr:fasciclin domain-containing protein [Planctomycetota bacterium]